MSTVTNLILSHSILEDDNGARIKEVNKFFEREETRGFVEAELPYEVYGGSKVLEAPIYIGAFNYLMEDEFLEYLRSEVNWEHPEEVQIIIKRQEDDLFSIINLSDLPSLPQELSKTEKE